MSNDISVKATVTINFKPFMVPNFAIMADKERASLALTDLDQGALNALAQRWLDDVYAKAEKTNPWQMKVYR